MSKNFKLKSGIFLKIENTDDGYDYSIFSVSKKLIDGGILENFNLTEKEAIKEILKMYKIPENIEKVLLEDEIEELV